MNNVLQLPTSWQIKTLGEVLNYEQPTKYIVKSTKYNDSYKTPVLTAGKSFILGYTDELEGIFTQIPVIIFDDFTTDTKFVDFKFKVKSSAMKILHSKENADIKFIYYFMQTIRHRSDTHKRYWISEYAKIKIPLPSLEIQKRIVARLESAFEKIEKGSAHLQNAKTKLAKYKQSLLKSVFDGTLFCHTEGEARSISNQESRDISLTLNMTNSPSLRANEVSAAIQNNDTTKALDCHSPNGLRNDSTHSSLRESSADEAIHKVDCHDLTSSNLAMTDKENPKLPQGWTIKTLGEVCEILDNMRKPINSTEREQRLKNSTTKYAYYGATGQVGYIDDFLCDFESILLGEDGAPFLEPFKDKAYIVSGKYWVNNHAHILKAKENFAINKFVCYFLNIVDYMPYVSGTTRLKLNQSAMKQIKIPLPPLEIQKQIVKLLEKHLQHADKTGEFIESALNKAKQLKQSLLKSAFLGKLT